MKYCYRQNLLHLQIQADAEIFEAAVKRSYTTLKLDIYDFLAIQVLNAGNVKSGIFCHAATSLLTTNI